MDNQYIAILKKFPLFRLLSDDEFKEVLSACIECNLKEDEILFEQGTESDSIYFLVSGYMLATIVNEQGLVETLGDIKTGEPIGEIGMLTQKNRTSSIKAIVQSKLIKLMRGTFLNMIKKHPEIISDISLLMANRYTKTMDFITKKKSNKHIMLMKINDSNITRFLDKLRKKLSSDKRICYCEEGELIKIYESEGLNSLVNYLDRLEGRHQFIVYYIESGHVDLLPILLRRTNSIYAISLANNPERYYQYYLNILKNNVANIKIQLILLWLNHESINNTQRWLDRYSYHLHHHIYLDDSSHYDRLLRFFINKPIAVVLSGGGSRGWFHLGVLKALVDKNIPVDMIGGTSVGAGIAAVYLCAKDFDETMVLSKKINKSIKKSLSLFSMTLPLTSLFDAYSTTKTFIEVYKNRRIEDLPINYFAVSTNFNLNREHIHKNDLVWHAVRASTSLPGIYPPLEIDGQLFYDGALINTLPTDRMRDFLGKEAIIIASDSSVVEPDKTKYSIPPSLPLFRLLLSWTRWGKSKYIYPAFLTSFFKSLQIGASGRQHANSKLATYLINADISEFGLFTFDENNQTRLMNKGYEEAMKKLSDFGD